MSSGVLKGLLKMCCSEVCPKARKSQLMKTGQWKNEQLYIRHSCVVCLSFQTYVQVDLRRHNSEMCPTDEEERKDKAPD